MVEIDLFIVLKDICFAWVYHCFAILLLERLCTINNICVILLCKGTDNKVTN